MDKLAFSIPADDGSKPAQDVQLVLEASPGDRMPRCADTGQPGSLALLEPPHFECLVVAATECDGDGD